VPLKKRTMVCSASHRNNPAPLARVAGSRNTLLYWLLPRRQRQRPQSQDSSGARTACWRTAQAKQFLACLPSGNEGIHNLLVESPAYATDLM
jgi:hypothetical protein